MISPLHIARFFFALMFVVCTLAGGPRFRLVLAKRGVQKLPIASRNQPE